MKFTTVACLIGAAFAQDKDANKSAADDSKTLNTVFQNKSLIDKSSSSWGTVFWSTSTVSSSKANVSTMNFRCEPRLAGGLGYKLDDHNDKRIWCTVGIWVSKNAGDRIDWCRIAIRIKKDESKGYYEKDGDT